MSTVYWPELGDVKPESQGELSYAHGHAGHYRLVTPLALSGQGVRRTQTYASDDLYSSAQSKVGWHVYYVTRRALCRLEKEYRFSWRALLD